MSISHDHAGSAVWTQFLSSVRGKLSDHVLKTWLEPAQCVSLQDGNLTLAVRDSFARDWLTNHYLQFMAEELTQQLGSATEVIVAVMPECFRETDNENPNEAPEPEPTPIQSSAGSSIRPPAANLSLVPDSVDPARAAPRHLNARYTFNEFVCGPSNQFAYAAARSVHLWYC